MKKYSRICAHIDLDAVDHNFEVMRSHLKEGTKICAVVKADCYGHGALQIARQLEGKPYIWGYACATPEEAMQLRCGGIMKPIILLGYAFEESYEDMIDYDIRACIFDPVSAEALNKTAKGLNKTALCHIALDTGMSRIGFQCTEGDAETIRKISELPNLKIEGMFTHFARADEKETRPIAEQLAKYQWMANLLETKHVDIPIHHVANSAALMRFPDAHLDMVRSGITNYGLMPSEEVASEMTELQPVLSLVSHVSFVKTLPAGRAISYGGTYVTKAPTRVATVPVGYADGWPRSLSNRGEVLIHGRRVPIIGRICMDQFMVDVTSLPETAVGDEVVLIGYQGEEHISAEEVGARSGRFNYELVCGLSKRVPRSYERRGITLEQVDYLG